MPIIVTISFPPKSGEDIYLSELIGKLLLGAHYEAPFQMLGKNIKEI